MKRITEGHGIVEIKNLNECLDFEDVENFFRLGGVGCRIDIYMPKNDSMNKISSKKKAYVKLYSEEDVKLALLLNKEHYNEKKVRIKLIDDAVDEEFEKDVLPKFREMLEKESSQEEKSTSGHVGQVYSTPGVQRKSSEIQIYSEVEMLNRINEYAAFIQNHDANLPHNPKFSTVLKTLKMNMYRYPRAKLGDKEGITWRRVENIQELSEKEKQGKSRVTFCVMSDSHGYEERIDFREIKADVLLHCGDFTDYSDWSTYRKRNAKKRKVPATVEKFNSFLGKLDNFRTKVCVAGNHDVGFKDGMTGHSLPLRSRKSLLSNAIYLNHESVEIDGVRIFGGSFNNKQTPDAKLQRRWKSIPHDTHILITHFPPFFYSGCSSLFEWSQQQSQQPKKKKRKRNGSLTVACFGHFHYRNFAKRIGHVTYIAAPMFHTQSMTIEPLVLFDIWV